MGTREYFEMCLKVLILAKESSSALGDKKPDRSVERIDPSASEPANGVLAPSKRGNGALGSSRGPTSAVIGLGSVPEQTSEAESEEWAQQTGSPASMDTIISRT